MTPSKNPYEAGSLAAELWAAAQQRAVIEPRAPAPPRTTPPGAPRGVSAVRARAEGGASHLQAGSRRRAVMDFIRAQPDATATITLLTEQFTRAVRGDVQKLLAKGHLEVVA